MKGCLSIFACLFLLLTLIFMIGTCAENSDDSERQIIANVQRKLRKTVAEIEVQTRKLRAAGYTQKQIEAASWKLLEETEKQFTAAEKRVFYKAVNQAFPGYSKRK